MQDLMCFGKHLKFYLEYELGPLEIFKHKMADSDSSFVLKMPSRLVVDKELQGSKKTNEQIIEVVQETKDGGLEQMGVVERQQVDSVRK